VGPTAGLETEATGEILCPCRGSMLNSNMFIVLNDCHVTKSFLGNHKAENYHQIVSDLLTAYKAMGCNMSLKVHFLDSHLDFFPENLGAVSDERHFNQDIYNIEKRYQGKWSLSMLAD
jgi:hypothetical protein